MMNPNVSITSLPCHQHHQNRFLAGIWSMPRLVLWGIGFLPLF